MSTISLQSVLYNTPPRVLEKLLATISCLRIPDGVNLTLRTGDCSQEPCLDDQVLATWQPVLKERGIEWRHTFFGENLGFGRGQNRLAADVPDAEAYLTLNPDALAPAHLLERLWGFANPPDSSAALKWGVIEARQVPLEHPKPVSSATYETPWASGCCALYNGPAFRDVGGFDESFFLYGEDVDLSLRLKDLGLKAYCCLDTFVYHGKRLGRQGPAASDVELEQSEIALDILKRKYGRSIARELRQRWTYKEVSLGGLMVASEGKAPQESRQDTLDEADGQPFVSVVVRTTGTRNELLTEALWSVYAQQEENYEVLLIVHLPEAQKAEEEPGQDLAEEVANAVRAFPRDFKSKVTLEVERRAGRSAPLNHGLDIATGRYVCFLDDDDLFFDHHFSALAEAADRDERKVYQTFAARRWVEVPGTADTVGSETFPYTVQEIQPYYTEPYSLLTQLHENVIPICNFFAPTASIHQHYLRFDESFEVREDWKFFMDVARRSEVVTIPSVTTAISVRSNATNTLSDPAFAKQWEENRQRMQKELGNQEWLLSPNELKELAAYGLLSDKSKRDKRLTAIEMNRLIDLSEPIHEELKAKKAEQSKPSLMYRALRAILKPVWSLRHKLPGNVQAVLKKKLLKENRTL